jgi:hypothetical protein
MFVYLQRSVDNFTPSPGEERDATLVGELAEAGYVKGRAMSDESGVTRGAVSWGVTVEAAFPSPGSKRKSERSHFGRERRDGVFQCWRTLLA